MEYLPVFCHVGFFILSLLVQRQAWQSPWISSLGAMQLSRANPGLSVLGVAGSTDGRSFSGSFRITL